MIKLIVGLGNPGEQYANTRHNLGFDALDTFLKKCGNDATFSPEKKFKAELAKFDYTKKDGEVVSLFLLKPQTYMNLSGLSVSALTNFFKIPPDEVLVIHDDLDLLLGKMKIRIGGSAAGHHGVENIIEKLGSDNFVRLRLGIGVEKTISGEHKEVHFQAEQFVIEKFEAKEKSKVKTMLKRTVQAIETILEKGLEKAQTEFNQ